MPYERVDIQKIIDEKCKVDPEFKKEYRQLKDLKKNIKLITKIGWDEHTNQYFAIIEDLGVDGVGDSSKDALDMAIDNFVTRIQFENE